jgi:hypothetical protein
MKVIRRLILILSALMGLWVIASFVGVMLNLPNIEFWTSSLMWSLLASVLVMPALVIAHHANVRSEREAARVQAEQTTRLHNQPPFIRSEEREGALWPETETKTPSED